MEKKMKSWFYIVTQIMFFIMLVSTCKKDDNELKDTVLDIDGNVYNTVTIGTQVWMKENLKTTKYKDGAIIPNVTLGSEWASLTHPAYCWFDNDIAYKPTYGALYNYYTVKTGRLCPSGWHEPTDEEWYTLENYIDPTINNPAEGGWRGTNAGTELKATSGWNNDGNGTDTYGFSALPGGGRRGSVGKFEAVGYFGYWWSSSEGEEPYALGRFLGYDKNNINRGGNYKTGGFSVRCIKD